LESNQISIKTNPTELLELLNSLSLRYLKLSKNSITASILSYRKSIITAVPTLNYLDDRPVENIEKKGLLGTIEVAQDCDIDGIDKIIQHKKMKGKRRKACLQL